MYEHGDLNAFYYFKRLDYFSLLIYYCLTNFIGHYSDYINSIFFISNYLAYNIKSIDFVISIEFSYDYE